MQGIPTKQKHPDHGKKTWKEKVKSYKLLPLVSTGCDSYASWDPRFKHLSPVLDTNTSVDTITDLLPAKHWKDEHLVITGGEPLLGWQRAYEELLVHPDMKDLKNITFETNGTQELHEELAKSVDQRKREELVRLRHRATELQAGDPNLIRYGYSSEKLKNLIKQKEEENK